MYYEENKKKNGIQNMVRTLQIQMMETVIIEPNKPIMVVVLNS